MPFALVIQKEPAEITTKLEIRGGTVRAESSDGGGSACILMEQWGGTLDLSGNTEDAYTIDSSTQHNGKINERSGLNNVTWTSHTQHGGEFVHESGSTIS